MPVTYTGPRTLRTDHVKTDVVTSSGAFTTFAKNFIPSGSGEYSVGATTNPVSNLYVEDVVYLADQQFYVDYWQYLRYKDAYVLTGILPTAGGGGGGSNVALKTFSYTGDGSTLDFYFPTELTSAENSIVSVGGVLQTPHSDYSLTGDYYNIGKYSGLNFIEAPGYLEDIEIRTITDVLAISAGESNTASNIGATSGIGIFDSKHGTDLRFRKITDGLGTYARLDASDNGIKIDSKMNFQGRILFPEDGEIHADFNGPGFQTVHLDNHLTINVLSGSLSDADVHAFTSPDQKVPIKNISIRLIGDSLTRNLFFDDKIRWIGDTPISLAANALGILSLTSFGPNVSDTIAAWGEELFSQPYYYPVVAPNYMIENGGFKGLHQQQPYTGTFDLTYQGTGCYLDYPSGMTNGQCLEIMLKPADHLSSITFSTKYRFASEYSCGFCNPGLNDVLTAGSGPITTGYIGQPYSGGWFGNNGVLTDGLLVKHVSGLSSGLRHGAGFTEEPNSTNTGIDLLTVKNINGNYLTEIKYRFI
jgi:hypothetical protein